MGAFAERMEADALADLSRAITGEEKSLIRRAINELGAALNADSIVCFVTLDGGSYVGIGADDDEHAREALRRARRRIGDAMVRRGADPDDGRRTGDASPVRTYPVADAPTAKPGANGTPCGTGIPPASAPEPIRPGESVVHPSVAGPMKLLRLHPDGAAVCEWRPGMLDGFPVAELSRADAERPKDGRPSVGRFVRVRVTGDEMGVIDGNLGEEPRAALLLSLGLPADAGGIGSEWDGPRRCYVATLDHKSFAPVLVGDEVPMHRRGAR